MGIFETKKEKEFYRIRRIIVKYLFQEYQNETNLSRKQWIEAMARSVALTPVEVFPEKHVIEEGVERKGDLFSFFQVKGQSLLEFMEMVTGNKKQVFVRNKIQMPNIWYGDKIRPDRLMTLLHEFGHNAELHHPNPQALSGQQKEQLADTLAVYTAKKLGFPEEVISRSLKGRKSILGAEYHRRLVETAKRREPPRIVRLHPPQRRRILRKVMPGHRWNTLTFPRPAKIYYYPKRAA